MPVKKEDKVISDWIYWVFIGPTYLSVKKELFDWQQHAERSFFFEVPEQEQTFSLPFGNVRVIVQEFDNLSIVGENIEAFNIHDISHAKELYRRLFKMIPNKTKLEKEIADTARGSAIGFFEMLESPEYQER